MIRPCFARRMIGTVIALLFTSFITRLLIASGVSYTNTNNENIAAAAWRITITRSVLSQSDLIPVQLRCKETRFY
jgi:hypothetical protein